MERQHTVMKKNNFQKAEDLRRLPTESRSLYTSQPHPAAGYVEAVQRVENKIATEVDFYPDSHTILMTHGAKTAKTIVLVHGYPGSPAPFKEIVAQFFDRGYNVLAMTMPYHAMDWQIA